MSLKVPNRAPHCGKTLSFMSNSNNRDIRLLPSKQGAFFLSLDGTALHSAYDPIREAAKTAAALDPQTEAVIIAENGLGYLPLQAAGRFPAADILMIVPDASVCAVLRRQYPELMPDFPKNIRILTPFSESALSLFLSGHSAAKTALLIPPPIPLRARTIPRARRTLRVRRIPLSEARPLSARRR